MQRNNNNNRELNETGMVVNQESMSLKMMKIST